MNLPVSYILLRLGAIPETVLIVAIAISQLCLATRLYMLRGLIGLKALDFLKQVYVNVIIVTICSGILPTILMLYFEDTIYSFMILLIVSLICVIISVLFVGCNKRERDFVFSKVKHYLRIQ